MSVIVLAAARDGIVIGSDRRTVIKASSTDGRRYTCFYDGTHKVISLFSPALTCVAAFYGRTSVGQDNIWSLMPEFVAENDPVPTDIRTVALTLQRFLRSRLPNEGNVDECLSVLVAGYDRSSQLPCSYRFDVPGQDQINPLHQPGEPFLLWLGDTGIIDRLILGYDKRLLSMFEETHTECDTDLLRHLTYSFPLHLLTLQARCDFVRILVTITNDINSFMFGDQTCGGGVDLTSLTLKHGVTAVNGEVHRWIDTPSLQRLPFWRAT